MGSKFVSSASIYLGANLINAGLSFILMPILTRVLSPADYGVISMFNIALNVFGALAGLSVHEAIRVRYFQMEKNNLAQYIGACAGILLVSTLLVLTLVVVFGDVLSRLLGVPADWLAVGVVLSSIQFIANIRLALWQAKGQAMQFGIFQVAQTLLNILISLLLIVFVGMAWKGRVLCQILVGGVFGVFAIFWLMKDRYLAIPSVWRKDIFDALGYGVPLIPNVIGATAIAISGRILISNMLDITSTGIYVVAMQLGVPFFLAAEAFGKAYLPWLFSKLKDESKVSRQFVVGINYLVFISFLVGSGVASAVIYWLFPYVVGVNFLPARAIVFWIILGNGFTGMYLAVVSFIFISSKTSYLSIATVSAGFISIAATFFLIKPFGVLGAGMAYLLSQVSLFLFVWFVSSRVYPMPWGDFRASIQVVCSILFPRPSTAIDKLIQIEQ